MKSVDRIVEMFELVKCPLKNRRFGDDLRGCLAKGEGVELEFPHISLSVSLFFLGISPSPSFSLK